MVNIDMMVQKHIANAFAHGCIFNHGAFGAELLVRQNGNFRHVCSRVL